ncbi:flagellar motor protein MotB [Lysinibacillus sp. 2017]|uniref:flagellar motor protein MotB n=1 Tax=unclassified Lysinibacillus TaxID=2636778 RepID=UPI000D528168|nr:MULTISPECIES: flagellar motor protein MotB [unclassified Lysinibacillus]AWE08755.1 flagellar motor protein MotB [Lysinibacillus sp. 2017]TGN36077.1 flagellar motor protein MotB [Lysinibacillus sp. S2017]
MAKKHKRHKKHEEHTDESWLVPYADILTLLLALFIVLFASSTVDQAKLEKMSSVFNEVFTSGTGVMDNPAVIQTPNGSETNVQSGASKYMQDQQALQQAQNRVDEFIAVNELEKQFETKMTDEGLLITIRDSVLFNMGEANVKSEYKSIADELSQLLMFDPPRNIVITGHSDNVPIKTKDFDSNWDLSVMRAVNFMKEVIGSNAELDSKYFSVKGYGEFSPIASNDTEEGRAKNRRVEVLVQPRISEDGKVITE